MNDLLKQKDIEAAQNLYNKIITNKIQFLELLDNILDLATFIPVCIAEYETGDFAIFNIDTLFIDEIEKILSDYEFQLIKQNIPPNFYD